MKFFRHFTVKKTKLLWGSLAYIFSARGLFINRQYVKRVVGKNASSYRNFVGTAGKYKVRKILSQKTIGSSLKYYTSFRLVARKCCYLLRKLRKYISHVIFFVYLNDEISAIFQFQTGSLACGQTRACSLRFPFWRPIWDIKSFFLSFHYQYHCRMLWPGEYIKLHWVRPFFPGGSHQKGVFWCNHPIWRQSCPVPLVQYARPLIH